MPAGDGTGPMGTGPMTGRQAGYCAGSNTPGFANPMPGRGRGMGFGRGRGRGRRGWRNQFYATGLPFWARNEMPEAEPPAQTPVSADDVETLKNQAGNLQQTLEQLQKRITELESAQASKD